ncbi:MAG TPA: thiamine pyrophosphate-dependent enzyme, partial [Syntrophorhabdaceae bacterium]|nr:thiamine pyrophosphate-dependent enzyme [Syntrophorhabdaceae bacterium]
MRLKGLELYTDHPEAEFAVSGHRACQGCAEILGLRMALKVFGKDTIMAMATGCMEIISTPLPTTTWTIPWIHVAFENAAAVASGIESAIRILQEKKKIDRKDIHVIAVAGDGGTSDIG